METLHTDPVLMKKLPWLVQPALFEYIGLVSGVINSTLFLN